ncbi:MAG: Fe-S cluster assembly ATPase SufC [Acidimicrobiales bacterium]
MTEATLFEIEDLHVAAAETGDRILNGVDLAVAEGEIHALMGPNGSGKSTLANTLLASPDYLVTAGHIRFKGEDITEWPADVRAKAGLFLAFQYPQEIPGVSVRNFLTQALQARKGTEVSSIETYMAMRDWMERLEMDSAFMDRHLNEGFSGGEKKRNEILQLAVLEPEMAVLDETDSGLDIDALRVVAKGVQEVRDDRPGMGVLVITHYQRLLTRLEPDRVHVLIDGRIAESGGPELARRLEREGYERYGS